MGRVRERKRERERERWEREPETVDEGSAMMERKTHREEHPQSELTPSVGSPLALNQWSPQALCKSTHTELWMCGPTPLYTFHFPTTN